MKYKTMVLIAHSTVTRKDTATTKNASVMNTTMARTVPSDSIN